MDGRHIRRQSRWVVALALVLCACADETATPTSAPAASASRPAFKIQSFQPETSSPETGADVNATAAPARLNDPSAAPDTPLCGRAAREAADAAAAISPSVTESGNACLASACFDPLTDTYIGADGYRHVCQ